MTQTRNTENHLAVFNFNLTGGFRAIAKMGMTKWYDQQGKQLAQDETLLNALKDALEGIEVIGFKFTDKDYDGYFTHGKKYKIEVETLQTARKEHWIMTGHFTFVGGYDITKFLNI